MPIREDIFAPIAGENPSGVDLHYDTKLLVFDKIKEARRQDDELNQGAWQSERKTANWPLVLKLTQDTLATSSKDLQLAAYLTEALLQTERFAGLRQGLDLIYRLLTEIWDSIYPQIEDGDRRDARPAAEHGWARCWIFRFVPRPLSRPDTPYRCLQGIARSGVRGSGEDGQGEEGALHQDCEGQVTARGISTKRLPKRPRRFIYRPKEISTLRLRLWRNSMRSATRSSKDDSPDSAKSRPRSLKFDKWFTAARKEAGKGTGSGRRSPGGRGGCSGRRGSLGEAGPAPAGTSISLVCRTGRSPPGRGRDRGGRGFPAQAGTTEPRTLFVAARAALGRIARQSRFARQQPVEAPPTELRQQVKRLALARKWAELLEAGEQALALPGSRAWLDLQRLSVTACTAWEQLRTNRDCDSIGIAGAVERLARVAGCHVAGRYPGCQS